MTTTITNKKKDIRQIVLKTAARLFYSQGYCNTGINQIIDESQISKASLYHYFPSKTNLLHAYLIDFDRTWFDDLDDYLINFTDPKQQLLAIIDFRIQRQISNQFGGCAFIKVSAEIHSDDTISFEIINTHKMKLKSKILEIVSRIDVIKMDYPREQLSEMIYFMIEGASATVNFQKNEDALRVAKEIISNFFKCSH